MMRTVTEMMATQLHELQDGNYTFYNLTDRHYTVTQYKSLNVLNNKN